MDVTRSYGTVWFTTAALYSCHITCGNEDYDLPRKNKSIATETGYLPALLFFPTYYYFFNYFPVILVYLRIFQTRVQLMYNFTPSPIISTTDCLRNTTTRGKGYDDFYPDRAIRISAQR